MKSANGSMNGSGSWISTAEQSLSASLRRHTMGQAVGAHPGCVVPGGVDRLVVFEEGNWWCRQCGEKGWWADPLPKEEIEQRKEQRRLNQEQLVAQMHACTDWLTYTQREERLQYWHEQGMTDEQMKRWGLGFCESTPMFHSPSLSIPVFYRGKLWDIRHRLLNPPDSATKYTSHVAGLTPPFFNLDSIATAKEVFVVEGEKKAIAVAEVVAAVIGVPGVQFYQRLISVVKRLCGAEQELVFIPDPGTTENVAKIAPELDRRCYAVELWGKPDDLLIEFGPATFQRCLEMRRPL